MKALALAVPLLFAVSVRADSLAEYTVEQEILTRSAIPLLNNVLDMWADNLITAQLPKNCSYCASEPDSLELSTLAVSKAISLEIVLDGLTFCDRKNCTIANDQSMVAIDDRVAITLDPPALNFGAVPVTTTPEPQTWLMLFLGFVLGIAVLNIVSLLISVSNLTLLIRIRRRNGDN